MCIDKGTAFLVTHGSLELVEPNARVNGQYFPFERLQSTSSIVSSGVMKFHLTYGTGRPTGAKSIQSCFTPMLSRQLLWRETQSHPFDEAMTYSSGEIAIT
jgi:hypothetical protein